MCVCFRFGGCLLCLVRSTIKDNPGDADGDGVGEVSDVPVGVGLGLDGVVEGVSRLEESG
ncbi:hypothetical protein COLO4_16570 [Corchorus olitorius]|uniref:Uncharacterized protein n=1 Tax=Corchorus olitorius TaxID=93759 RepID=A0A1R3JGR6_9ROSI|nr:hypothetical protein COLO4_16570 [Corchorus olitorius]